MVKPNLEFAGEFVGETLRQITYRFISTKTTHVFPCILGQGASLGHELTTLGMTPIEWSQCDMVQAASRPEFYDSMNLGLRAALGRCAHPVARGEPALGFDGECRVVSIGQGWQCAQGLNESTGFDLLLRPTLVGCVE